jgi:GT2 family glycosyltransferase
MAERSLISVVIPHFDDLDNLAKCLALLSSQSLDKDQFEIIVADNNSRCGLAAVRQFCGTLARVIEAPIQGAAAARNAAVAVAVGHYIAFLDSDCLPDADWLEQGVKALEQHPLCGGCVRVSVADRGRITGVEAFELVFAFNNENYVTQKNFSVTANLFVRREVFDRTGEFHGGVSEDLEWCLRARDAGYAIHYAAGAVVSHPARHSWGDLVKKWRRLVRESYELNRDHRFGAVRWLVRSWIVLLSPFGHISQIFRSPHLTSFGEKLRATLVLFRIRWWRFVQNHKILLRI